MRLHACSKFVARERLDQIVIRACLQPFNLHLLTRARRQDDDRGGLQFSIRPYGSEELVAVYIRHHHIRQYKVRMMFSHHIERFTPVASADDPVFGPQYPRHVLTHIRVVICYKDAGSVSMLTCVFSNAARTAGFLCF